MNKSHEYLRNLQYPEDKYYLQLRNIPIWDIFNFQEKNDKNDQSLEKSHYLFDEFLESLRSKWIPVSPPEWLHFMKIVEIKAQNEEILTLWNFFDLLRIYAQTTLIKDKWYATLFHEAFDEYFMRIKKLFELELNGLSEERNKQKWEILHWTKANLQKAIQNIDKQQAWWEELKTNTKESELTSDDVRDDNKVEEVKKFKKKLETNPNEIKEKLWIKEVKENKNMADDDHNDDEEAHWGKDQHNDILQNIDESKLWWWNQKQNNEKLLQKNEKFIWWWNLKYTKSIEKTESTFVGFPNEEKINTIKIQAEKYDNRKKYEKRPDKLTMKAVVRALRKIIISTSEIKSSKLDVRQSVKNISKKNYGFEYSHEKTKSQELVLFIDVWWPVDTRRPIINEVTESMTKGLSKLEVYLFHNNLYGYARPYDKKNPSNYAKQNWLVDVKDIIKHRKKVIIYWDAEMSEPEVYEDMRVPTNNEEKIKQYGMWWEECLNYIKNKSNSIVWLNPIFKKDWSNADDSWSISKISSMIPMYDLTVWGIENAISFLMRK